ncbi:MAG: Zn-ribbon domain-containing OB-fold protein [Acidimicrobiales bacterium]
MTTAAPYDKPLPSLSNLNRPFYEGLKERRLTLQRCLACREIWYPPGPFCPACWSRDIEWAELSGRGKVTSWVVFHQAYYRSFEADLPYNVAEVELEEGPRLLTNLVGVANDEIRLGMPVEIVYDDVTDAITLAKFRPAGKG